MKELADAAGVNPALLYQHFESKEELFEEAVLRPLASAFEETARGFPDVIGPEPRGEVVREATEAYLALLLEAMDKTAGLLGVVLFDDLENGREFFRERLEPILAELSDVVRAHLPAWAHADYDPEVAVRIVFGTCWLYAIENHFGTGAPAQPSELAPQIGSIIFEGLLPR